MIGVTMFVTRGNPPILHKNGRSNLKGNSAFKDRIEALKNFTKDERLECAGMYVYFVKSDDNANAVVANRIGGPTRPVNPLVLKKP